MMMMMMMMSRRRTRKVVAKAKRPRRSNITAPHLLHSKSEGDPTVYQLPPRSKTSLRLRREDQQIPRLSEAEIQRDEVSRLSRADDTLLPVAMHGIMEDHVRETLFGICNFFDVISRKSVGARQLKRIQEEIVV